MPHTYLDYTIHFDQLLGKGGFCAVYKATDPDGKVVAMKVPLQAVGSDTWDSDTTFNKRFEREARIWSSLCDKKIPGVVEVYGHGIKPHPWLAMELMEGGTLRTRINKGLSIDESLEIIKPVIKCLSEVHFLGIIHRDIKPENILFTKNNVPKVADWGLVKALMDISQSSEGVKGTLKYLAPEQFRVKEQDIQDRRTDIYQLGAVLYEMVTGKPPFPTSEVPVLVNCILNEQVLHPFRLNPKVSATLGSMIMKCLEKEKEKRYGGLRELLRELEEKVETVGGVKKVKKVKKAAKPKTPVSASKEKCSSCRNLITFTNKLLRCFGCQKFFCETCEGWFRAERKRGEKPFCEKCYGKEMKRRELEERKKKEEEEQGRKALEEQRRRDAEKRIKELEGEEYLEDFEDLDDFSELEDLAPESTGDVFLEELVDDSGDDLFNEQSTETMIERGNINRNLHNYKDAVNCYNKAIMYNPNNWNAWYLKGICLALSGRFDESVISFTEALLHNPENPDILKAKRDVLQRLVEKEDAHNARKFYAIFRRGINDIFEAIYTDKEHLKTKWKRRSQIDKGELSFTPDYISFFGEAMKIEIGTEYKLEGVRDNISKDIMWKELTYTGTDGDEKQIYFAEEPSMMKKLLSRGRESRKDLYSAFQNWLHLKQEEETTVRDQVELVTKMIAEIESRQKQDLSELEDDLSDCPRCSQPVPADATKCPNCGVRFVE